MFIQEYRGAEGFRALKDEWEGMRRRVRYPHIFSSWEWVYTWWSCCAPEVEPILMAAREPSGELRGLAAFSFQQERAGVTARFLGDVNTCDYMDFLLQEGYERPVLHALMTHLSEELAPTGRMDLRGIPAHSRTRGILAELVGTAGLAMESSVEEGAPILELPANWDSYLALLSKKDRHELRRKLRRINGEAHVELLVVEEVESLIREMPSFLELHAKSNPSKAEFMNGRTKEFFAALPEVLGGRGWMALYFLLLDGEKAASLLCFRYEETVFVYNSGYDPRFSRLSPGVAVIARVIDLAVAEGYRRFDFLRGQEDYKYRLGAGDRPIYRLRVNLSV